MAIYYVSATGNPTTGKGTIGKPFRHIKDGVAACTKPGDRVFIRGGTYAHEYDRIDNTAFSVAHGTIRGWGSSFDGAITIAGFPGETVVIAPPNGLLAVSLVSPSYLVFQNLTLEGVRLEPEYALVEWRECIGQPVRADE